MALILVGIKSWPNTTITEKAEDSTSPMMMVKKMVGHQSDIRKR